MKERGAPTWGKLCPGCGKEVAEDTVVCHRCGWNFKSGKKVRGAASAWRRKRILGCVAKGIGAALVVWAAAVGVRWVQGHRSEAERWVGEGVERVRDAVGMEAESREETVRERLDRELPMWRDEVSLEKSNGAVLEGVLRETGNGVAIVETAAGARTVAMADLSGRSRARVDEEYREQIIRARKK